MKVLFLTTYFPPEIGAAQARTRELSTRLATMGNEVFVLTTFPNYPSGVVPKEWRGRLFWKGTDQGVRVYRIWSYAVSNKRTWKRILSHVSFVLFASVVAPFISDVDLVIVESHPLFNGLAGMFTSLIKRVPYALNVSDLWPGSAVESGWLKNRTLIQICKWMELLFYRRAALILAMTAGIKHSIVSDGVDPDKVILFRNTADHELFHPGVDGSEIRFNHGLSPQTFVVLYAGTFGRFNDVDTIVGAAVLFQRKYNDRVRFLFVGDGAEKEKLMARVSRMQLRNVKFLDPLPNERMPKLFSAADCVVITRRNFEQGALPRKLFEAMACAKPVVLAATGEAANLVAEVRCGVCVAPEDHKAVYDAILKVWQSSEEADLMGKRGREYLRVHFCPARRAAELIGAIQELKDKMTKSQVRVGTGLQRLTIDRQEQTVRKSGIEGRG